MRILRTLGLVISLPLCGAIAQAIQTYSLNPSFASQPPSNAIDALVRTGDTLWVGTSKGLGWTINGTIWKNFSSVPPFDGKGISAIAVHEGLIWTAVGYSTEKDGEFIQTGGGLNWSTNGGVTWSHVPQPLDQGTVDTLIYGANMIRALAVTVPQFNITFDVALTSGTIWIASFAGMLRRSTNSGVTWERVILPPDNRDSITPSDTLDFDLAPSGGSLGLRENLNHRTFSVHASNDTTLWVGTAAGINRSTDGGVSWSRFAHQNQANPISGNFVVAINEQRYQTKRVIWAATVNAVAIDEQPGVSFSEDMGLTWVTSLLGERAHNISFKDSIVYVASDRGVFRSDDQGRNWSLSGTIVDPTNLSRFSTRTIHAVAVHGDTVWVGGPDGIAYTLDNPVNPFGSSWRIFRTFDSVSPTDNTYAYPNPFSPDDEVVRIHYALTAPANQITIRVFDYAMQPVRTIIQNAPRPGGTEYDEIWDGRNDEGELVTNGPYFYRIQIGSEVGKWGKILVIR